MLIYLVADRLFKVSEKWADMTTTVARSLGAWRIPVIFVALLASLLLIVPFLILVSTSWTQGGFILFPPDGFSCSGTRRSSATGAG